MRWGERLSNDLEGEHRMERPQGAGESLTEIARDATAAAMVHLVERLKIHPGHKERITALLTATIRSTVECGILLDRKQRLMPSKN
jgi:hypothetical protein